MKSDLSMYEPIHRALLVMVRERLTDTEWAERRPDGLAIAQLMCMLRDLMREECVQIPAGTFAATCRRCHQTIYWVVSRATPKYRESVSLDVGGSFAPTATQSGEGVPHLATCPHSGLVMRGAA